MTRQNRRIVQLVALIALFAYSNALYESGSKVVKLTAQNFKEKVLNSKELWFVEFFGKLDC